MQTAQEQMQIFESWERNFAPKNLLHTDHNKNTLAFAVRNHIDRTGDISINDMVSIVTGLGDIDVNGTGLQYHKPPQIVEKPVEPPPSNPADNLPHPNEPKLKSLVTIEDFKELTKERLRDVFMQPVAIESGLKTKFDERYAYVVRNRIHREVKEEVPQAFAPKKPTRIVMLTPEQERAARDQAAYDQTNLDEANSLISRYTSTNHGRTEGYRTILRGVRDAAIKSGKGSKEVLALVRAKWQTLP